MTGRVLIVGAIAGLLIRLAVTVFDGLSALLVIALIGIVAGVVGAASGTESISIQS